MKHRYIPLCIALWAVLGLSGCARLNVRPYESSSAPSSVVSSSSSSLTPEVISSSVAPEETVSSSTPPELPQPPDDPATLVRITDYLPSVIEELHYATEDNFTGQVIYDFTEARLRYGTVEKLGKAAELLEEQGLRIKVWDAYRPVSAQFRLWEVTPDPAYVADPTKGYSSHSRGNTVDITVVDLEGNEVSVPTQFDDFTKRADRDYDDCEPEAAKNALLLENIMIACGFKAYHEEWWHFSDVEKYDVVEEQ